MDFKIAVIKKHPVITGSVVILAGVVFYVIYSGGSKSAPGTAVVSGGSNGPSASDLQGQQIQGQLAALGLQAQTQITLANIAAQNDINKSAYQLEIAHLEAGLQAAHDQQAYDLAKYQTSAQLEAVQTQYESVIQQSQINANAQIQSASLNADVTKFTAALNSQLQQSMIDSNTLIAQYNAQAAVAGAQAYSSAAKAQASASKTSSYVGLALGLASLFCDVNIKSVGHCVDSEMCLRVVRNLPLDYWRYIEGSTPHSLGDHSQHVGTYAQSFYCALGVEDWDRRRSISTLDMFGVLIGAIKALENKS